MRPVHILAAIVVTLASSSAALGQGFPSQPGDAQSQPYAGKTITIVVGFKPGGGYDATARLLARHLPKHVPGKPIIIVQNMPGAGSIVAANHLYGAAKPDGLTIGAFHYGLPIAQLTKVEGVRFDITKFAWVGSAASETTILAIRSDLPYKTFEDLKKAKQPVMIGSAGPGAASHDFPLLLKELLGANLKIVSGYPGSADIMLAIERKEADGRAGSYASIRPFIDRGLVRPLIRGRATATGIEQLPVDENLAPTPLAKSIMALRSIPGVIGRPYVMPPGTPAALVGTMRVAFDKAIKDPELIRANKTNLELEFVSGDEALKVMREALTQPKDVVDQFSKYIKFGE